MNRKDAPPTASWTAKRSGKWRAPFTGTTKRLSASFKVGDIRLLTPCEPAIFLCVGLNYRSHIQELGQEVPVVPSHFLKPHTAIIGPGDPIVYPRVAERVDYEGEIAVVIKDTVKDVSEQEALDHVLGYTCCNDVTERKLTKVFGQLIRAKGFDTFGAFGPCIETDLDPTNITVRTVLNGKVVQEGNSGELVFSVAYLVSYVSQCMTLHAGDIISTGTPGGIGPMNIGDLVEVHVEGVGELKNPIEGLS